jgi:hypothetical protein
MARCITPPPPLQSVRVRECVNYMYHAREMASVRCDILLTINLGADSIADVSFVACDPTESARKVSLSTYSAVIAMADLSWSLLTFTPESSLRAPSFLRRKSNRVASMGKERFQSNPYPGVSLSEEDELLLLQLANTLIQENFVKYKSFVMLNKRKVDKDRWKHVKSRDAIHAYVRREDPHERQMRLAGQSVDIPVMLTVGEFAGKMADHMLGVMNPTLNSMRMKASFVHDVSDAAILASPILPSAEKPFTSAVVKWMQLDLPLEATNLIKNRDFVYIEATGFQNFSNGERVGYHLMHSVDFSQTRPLPNIVRGNLSICCMFRQLRANLIDYHSLSTFEPGGDLAHFLVLPIAADRLLSATNHEPYGQTVKLAWMMQRCRQESSPDVALRTNVCVTCMKSLSKLRGLGSSTCKICFRNVCRSCRVRKLISMVAPDGKLLQPTIVFCARCVTEVSSFDAEEVARDLITGYTASKVPHTLASSSSTSDTRSN